jgi:NADPH:quinone reductase-like Zn-dependent oxidoreductase
MKAVVLHEYGAASKLLYQDFDDPVPGIGEVLVRVSATSLNPVDWMLRSGAIKDLIPIEFPYILGVDLAGIVLKVGESVTVVEAGDRVMALTSHTYAELCIVKATDVVKKYRGPGADDRCDAAVG